MSGMQMHISLVIMIFSTQKDGNFVLYRTSNNQALWASGTNGSGSVKAVMQYDGNLVVYDSNQRARYLPNVDLFSI